jgi:hypothetical protein
VEQRKIYQTHQGKGNIKMEAETKLRWPQAKEANNQQIPGSKGTMLLLCRRITALLTA